MPKISDDELNEFRYNIEVIIPIVMPYILQIAAVFRPNTDVHAVGNVLSVTKSDDRTNQRRKLWCDALLASTDPSAADRAVAEFDSRFA